MEPISVVKDIKSYLDKNNIKKDDRILIAFSGGKDSLALLKALSNLDYKVFCVYINHKLRSDKELEKEIELNKSNCNKFNTKLIVINLKKNQIYELEKERNRGIEDSARYLRYKKLEEERQRLNCKYIATAHSLSDFRETILIRLKRNENFISLQSINSKKNNIIRPLLTLESKEIIEYVKDLECAKDSTNNSLSYTRNYIRHQLSTNKLKWPMQDKQLSALAKRAKEHRLTVEKQYNYLIDKVINNSIDKKYLKKVCVNTRILFYQRIIKDMGLNLLIRTSNLLYIDSLIGTNNKVETHHYKFESIDNKLIWNKNNKQKINYFFSIVDKPKNLLYYNKYLIVSKYDNKETTNIYLEDKFDCLIARSYLSGDKIELDNRTVLISKLLKDWKVDKDKRKECILLCNQKEIVGVIASHIGGYNRISKSNKITNTLDSINCNMYSIGEDI